MSVLTNLQLQYENLADDPIDRGIFYGKSVLQALTAPLQLAPAVVEQSTPMTEEIAIPVFRASRPVNRSQIERTRYAGYATRPSYYTQRTMIGAF